MAYNNALRKFLSDNGIDEADLSNVALQVGNTVKPVTGPQISPEEFLRGQEAGIYTTGTKQPFQVDPSKQGYGALYDEQAGKFRSGGFIRDESTGQTTTFASQPQRPRGVRTFGVDPQAGAIKDMGAAPIDGDPIDYSYGDGGRQGVKKVVVPGLGEGVMGKDGFVYGRDNAGNPIWRASLNYSQAQERADQDYRLKQTKTLSDVEKTLAETQNLRTGGPVKPVWDSERGAWIRADGSMQQVQGLPQTQKQIDAGIQADKSLQSGEMMLGKIKGMIGERDSQGNLIGDSQAHPGFETSVGMGLGGITKYIPGTDAANFRARYDEIKGAAFLQAFEQLKGGGAITEVEGKKATDAITRMNTSQSEKEFVTAAKEFENVVKTAMNNAQRSKGGQAAPAGGMRFGGLPNAAGFRGKRIRDDSTGRILVSDGSQWVPQ